VAKQTGATTLAGFVLHHPEGPHAKTSRCIKEAEKNSFSIRWEVGFLAVSQDFWSHLDCRQMSATATVKGGHDGQRLRCPFGDKGMGHLARSATRPVALLVKGQWT
jgi:hypothetical protein